MKFKATAFALIGCALCINNSGFSQNLPVKEILGKEYYVYEIKKDDSVYGIVHRFGWDETEFLSLNPSIAQGLTKGKIVYYPTGNSLAVTVEEPSKSPLPIAGRLPVLKHTVKRGETVYGIAKFYEIPLDVIYQAHPSAKTGLTAGEILEINQNDFGFANPEAIPFFYREIAPGETLYSTANEFGISVADLLNENPGVSETNFRAGSLLKIPVRNIPPKVVVTKQEQQEVTSITGLKTSKNDSWASLASKTGKTEEELKEANKGISKLKANTIVAVPEITTVEVEKEIPYSDPREDSREGRLEIYDSIHHLQDDFEVQGVRIAVIVDDPDSKRDVEFSRGLMLALKEMGNPGYKVDVAIIPASRPVDEVINELNDFNPQAVFSLADKGVAEWLVNFGERIGVEIMNVFDAKSDSYSHTPAIVQLLTPSGIFNEAVAESIASDYPSRKLVTVTKGVTADLLADAIAASFPSGETRRVTVDNLNPTLLPEGDLLVVADITDKEDIEKLLEQVQLYKEENPAAVVSIIGKPSWITFAESMAEQFYTADVTFPSRFFFNPESEEGRTFITDYTSVYGRGPLKSFPNYAATGYDAANWLVPALALNHGDFNVELPEHEFLQMPVSIERANNWGGFANVNSLLVRYTPWRTIEIKKLK